MAIALIAVLPYSCFAAADTPFKYTGVFTRDIYDQTDILSSLSGDDTVNQPIIEEHLLARKRTCVEAYVQKILDQRAEWHRARETSAGEVIDGLSKGSADDAEDITLGSWFTPFFPKLTRLGRAAGKIEAHADKVARKTVTDSLLQAQVSSVTQSHAKLEELMFFKEFMSRDESLHEEYLWEKEIAYLLNKRYMQPSIAREIEEIFLYARQASFSEGMREKVDFLMRVPHRLADNIAEFGDTAGCESSLRALRRDFKEYPPLAHVADEVKDRLWGTVVRDLAMTTAPQGVDGLPRRHCFYFYGHPGTGKSYTAKQVAGFLGWSYHNPVLLAESDFSRGTLYGTSSDPGIILSTYGGTADGGDAGGMPMVPMNAVLVLDDFDRLLLGDNPAHCTAALSFLQSFLDRNLTKIFSPYVDGDIDISRLSIIITGNSDLIAACRERGGEYGALLSRLRVLRFPRPSKDDVLRIIEPELSRMLAAYHLGGDGQIRDLVSTYVLSGACPTDLREVLDKHLVTIIHHYLEDSQGALRLYGAMSRRPATPPPSVSVPLQPDMAKQGGPKRELHIKIEVLHIAVAVAVLGVATHFVRRYFSY